MNTVDPYARVRCTYCGKWGLHANGPQCFTCGTYLPLPGMTPAAPPKAVAPAPGRPPQGGTGRAYAPAWSRQFDAPPSRPWPVAPVARRQGMPRWARLLAGLVTAVILRILSAVGLHPLVMSSHSKLFALLDLVVLISYDIVSVFTLGMATVWGIAWLVKRAAGR
jgi:hypothetical protein